MPFIYAFNTRDLVWPALTEIQELFPIYDHYATLDLFGWWLSLAIERIFLIECTSSYPVTEIYPYLDFVGLDTVVGEIISYRRLLEIIRTRNYGTFTLKLTSDYDGFLILDL